MHIGIPKRMFEPAPSCGEVYAMPPYRARGYFADAWHRFLGLATVRIALSVLSLICLFSVLAPLFISRSVSHMDPYYAKLPPRISALSGRAGIADGSVSRRLGDEALIRLYAIGIGAGDARYSPVISVGEGEGRVRRVKLDAYLEVGFVYKDVTEERYLDMREWEREEGLQLLYPMIDNGEHAIASGDANLWYKVDESGLPIGKESYAASLPMMPALEDNYMRSENGELIYSLPVGVGGSRRVRVLYYNYYLYENGTPPNYLLGTDSQGYDLALRVAGGVRVSLLLALLVSAVNFVIGALVGAVEGYYGGAVDLIVERVTDILSGVPFIVVATLFQIYLSDRVGTLPSLLFAFVLTGWLGVANRVRGQFFRFKGAEYVLAARSMGLGDGRIMWRHIFPNTLGTLITATALAIPGVIFTESMLSFLGIVNLGAEGVTSLGTLLADASGIWVNYPHLMIAPAAVISLFMISFNMIGNGLRDAFDPATRGGV